MCKSVDNFSPWTVFRRTSLHPSEADFYEGEWLANLPDGRTLEFDSEAAAQAEMTRLRSEQERKQ